MTVAIQGGRERARAVALVRRVNFAVVVFLALYVAVGLLQPNYLELAGAMNFLRRAAPLAILASGQLFVLISGGFDLSVGSLVTLTVIGGSMLTANDPSKTWGTIAVLYGIGLTVGLINGAVVAYLKTPSIIATLGTLLSVNGAAMMWSGGSPRGYLPDNFRMFGRLVFHDVPVIGIFPLAVACLAVVCALAQWGLHGTVFGRRVFAVGDNPRAAELAGVRVDIRPSWRLRHFGAVRSHRRGDAGRLWRRIGRCGASGSNCRRLRLALLGRAIAWRARHGCRRSRRRADPHRPVHAADAPWLAAADQGDGARIYSDRRGRYRRLAPTARGLAGAIEKPAQRRATARRKERGACPRQF